MLTWLRDSAKIFLIVTIVVFVSLIFLRWGMGAGGGESKNPYERPIATVNGKEILPAEYSASIQDYSNSYRDDLEQIGNPDPEGMLVVMGRQINEDAFEGMIDSYLEQDYLETVDLPQFTYEQTEALIFETVRAQNLEGVTPEEYIEEMKTDNPYLYQQYIAQFFYFGNAFRFPIASELVGMSSKAETEFLMLRERGSITARFITFEATAMMPGEQALTEYYEENIDLFAEAPGSLLRYVTVQVQPTPDDYARANDIVDSLTYASAGSPKSATREQFISTFGTELTLETGQPSIPIFGMSLEYPAFESFHVLRLDSTAVSIPETPEDTMAYLQDTLFVTHWERIVFPGISTVNNLLWTLERESETILATEVPSIDDSLIVSGFGDMRIDGNTTENAAAGGIISQELIAFATDSIWHDSIGPVFYKPAAVTGYPEFTIVRKLETFEADTLSMEKAMQNGLLFQLATSDTRRSASFDAAAAALDYIRIAGISLGAYADAESLEIYTTQPFSAAEVARISQQSPYADGGILYSAEFAELALAAPEFTVIGPFRTGDRYVLAEILTRQMPPENPSFLALTYAVTQGGHILLTEEHILDDLRESGDVVDLREQWSEYNTSFRDSLELEEEKLDR